MRLSMLILALWLPLQSAWGAVLAYCEHEAGPTSAHFGHHEHPSTAPILGPAADHLLDLAANEEAVVDESKTEQVSPDCGHCHGLHHALLKVGSPASDFVAQAAPSRRSARMPLSAIPPPLERPKWYLLA